MANILITAIGSFSADIVIHNLMEKRNYIVGCDIYPSTWIAQSSCVDKFYQVPQAIETEDYIREIYHICEKEKIEYIMPLTDVEVDVYSKEQEYFERRGIRICISSPRTVRLCRNKWDCYQYLLKAGVPGLIPTKKMTDGTMEGLKYPLIAKPISGRSSQGVIKLQNETDYAYYAGKVEKSQYIIQPCLDENVITVDIICDRECVYALPRREFLRTLNGAGISVQIFHNDEIINFCSNLAKLLEIEGCVNIELLEEEDGYYFLECNPRFSGGVAFSCMAGYDFVSNHLRYFMTGKIEALTEYRDMFITRKYKEYIK